jgi:hypothetical protein
LSLDDERLDVSTSAAAPASSGTDRVAPSTGPQRGDDLRSLERELATERLDSSPPGSGADLDDVPAAFGALTAMGPAPQPALRRSPASWAFPLVVGLGLGLASAGAFFAISGAGRPTREATGSIGHLEVQRSEPAQAPAPTLPQPPPVAPPDVSPEVVATTLADELQPPPSVAPRGARRPGAAGSSVPASPSKPATTAEPVAVTATGTPAPVRPTSEAEPVRSMDRLLDEALAPADAQLARREREQAAALGATGVPAFPSRDDVTRSMTVLLPAIRGCTAGQSGLATATIVVRNDGRVAKVDVEGAPFGGSSSGRCMEGVIRRARFPVFAQPTFRVRFPFSIQ